MFYSSELSHEQVLGIKTVLEGFDLTQKEIDSILKELPSLDIPDRLVSSCTVTIATT